MPSHDSVTANNDMDVEEANPFPPSVNNTLRYNFSLPSSYTYVPIEKVPNSRSTNETDISSDPSPLSVILYSTNIPVDSSLWDRGFVATSIFGMNEFLQSDICNIACLLGFLYQTKESTGP